MNRLDTKLTDYTFQYTSIDLSKELQIKEFGGDYTHTIFIDMVYFFSVEPMAIGEITDNRRYYRVNDDYDFLGRKTKNSDNGNNL